MQNMAAKARKALSIDLKAQAPHDLTGTALCLSLGSYIFG